MGRMVRRVALASTLSALGVVVAPFLWFPFLATKAYPGQHLINAISGVLLGPVWAAGVAFMVGIIRMSLNIGTIYSMPGGIPGALVVGLLAWLLRRAKKKPELAALGEPIGTVFVGATLAVYLFAPSLGHAGMFEALLPVYAAWAISSVPGCVMGFLVLEVLRRVGLDRESLGI